jgi:heme o synthase
MSLLRDYIELCKPRVVALMTLTAIVAMFLAAPPGELSWRILIVGAIGITLAACCGGVINQLIDRHIDAVMARTQQRPLAAGRIRPWQAWIWAAVLLTAGMIALIFWVNPLVAYLSFLAMVGYAGIYTLFLKRATPQNIVIGGLAGAMPPLLGWTAVTGHVDAPALLLVLIIYAWTPPHFWSLAIHRQADYAKANIPMLPVTHGLALTRLSILLYTCLMIAVTYLPFIINAAGVIYVVGVTVLNGIFLYYAIGVYRNHQARYPMATFRYSIIYLLLLFLLLLADHFI